jgi:hypothetical protein
MVAMSTVGDIAAVITALAVFAATIAGYIEFVVRRAVAAQFDVEFVALGSASGMVIGDLSCVIKNLGSNVLVVTRVGFRGRYSVDDDLNKDMSHNMEPVLSRDLLTGEHGKAAWITLFPQNHETRSVVFPGGTQAYRKPLALRPGARVLTIWATCNYSTPVGRFNHRFMKLVLHPPEDLDFAFGLRNHRVRRTFSLVPCD